MIEKEYVYAVSEEDEHWYDSEADAVDQWKYENEDETEGIIYEGEKDQPAASHFLPGDVAELMLEAAYDQYGERSESWGFSKAEKYDLQAVLECAVDEWASKHKASPTFFRVSRCKPVRIRLADNDDGYERIDDGQNV